MPNQVHGVLLHTIIHLAMRRHKSIAKVAMGPVWQFACTGCGGMVVSIHRRSTCQRGMAMTYRMRTPLESKNWSGAGMACVPTTGRDEALVQ